MELAPNPSVALMIVAGLGHIETAIGKTPPKYLPLDPWYRLPRNATPRSGPGKMGRGAVADHRGYQADEHGDC
jgi:hypothetical protein